MRNHRSRVARAHEKRSLSDSTLERVDLSSLSQALLVADYTSFSHAAKVLGVRQSAVSPRIQALEDKLGVSLFERRLNGVRPTFAGRRFVERTRAALAEIDHAIADAATAGRGAEGIIRVGVSPFQCSDFLRDLRCAFQETQPAVAFDYVDWPPRKSVAGIMERRLDVAFVINDLPTPGCDMETLWTADVFVALPDKHPLSGCATIEWELLKDERFIVGRNAIGAGLDDWASEIAAKIGDRLLPTKYDLSQDWIMRLVAHGFGVGLVNAATGVSASGIAFRPLAGEEKRVSYCAVWLPGNDNPALRRFLSLARTQAAGWQKVPASASAS